MGEDILGPIGLKKDRELALSVVPEITKTTGTIKKSSNGS